MSAFPWSFATDPAARRPKRAIVAGMIYAGEVAALTALPFTGKSVIAARMAVDVMSGRSFFGRAVEKGIVLYVAAEREHETRARIEAMLDGGADVPVMGRPPGVATDLRTPAFADGVVDTIREVEANTGRPVNLVIFDTLARLQPGADEISAKDMGAIADALARVADLGPAVLVLCHPPKHGGGVRGSGAIAGAVDRILELKVTKSRALTLSVTEANSGPEGASVSFRIASVEMDRDQNGEAVTVAVAVPLEEFSAKSEVPRASRAETERDEIALAILRATGGAMERKALLAAMRDRGVLTQKSASELLRQCLVRLKAIGDIEYDEGQVRLQDAPNPPPPLREGADWAKGIGPKRSPKSRILDLIGPLGPSPQNLG